MSMRAEGSRRNRPGSRAGWWIPGWGLAAAGVYLAAAVLSWRAGLLPVRPLYEGTAPPQPYRWVRPPPELAASNQPATSGTATLDLTRTGSAERTVATEDGQALVTFYEGSVAAKRGQTGVKVVITPVDPSSLGAPPGTLNYDGNAYRVEATYEPSGKPAELAVPSCAIDQVPKLCPTIVLRYPLHSTAMFRREGSAWIPLEAKPVQPTLQIYADTASFGTFVTAGALRLTPSRGIGAGQIAGIVLGVVAVAGSLVMARWRAVRRWLRRRRKRKAKAARSSAGQRRPRR